MKQYNILFDWGTPMIPQFWNRNYIWKWTSVGAESLITTLLVAKQMQILQNLQQNIVLTETYHRKDMRMHLWKETHFPALIISQTEESSLTVQSQCFLEGVRSRQVSFQKVQKMHMRNTKLFEILHLLFKISQHKKKRYGLMKCC